MPFVGDEGSMKKHTKHVGPFKSKVWKLPRLKASLTPSSPKLKVTHLSSSSSPDFCLVLQVKSGVCVSMGAATASFWAQLLLMGIENPPRIQETQVFIS